MEIQYHPLQGMRWMMYYIIVFQNHRCRLSKTRVFGARKRPLIVDGRQYWDTFFFCRRRRRCQSSQDVSMCVNGWESVYVCSMNGCESAYHTCSKSGTIYESRTVSSSINLFWDAILVH